MAGFGNRGNNSILSGASRLLNRLSKVTSFGMNWKKDVIENSVVLNSEDNQHQTDNDGNLQYLFSAMSNGSNLSVIPSNEYSGDWNAYYSLKRNTFRKLSQQDEIENVLDIICDDTIIYKETKFAEIKPCPNLSQKINDEIKANFEKLYTYFSFNNITAWNYFRKFLIDGTLCFEIVYDKEGKNIIGIVELDSAYVSPGIDTKTSLPIWYVQTPPNQVATNIENNYNTAYLGTSNINIDGSYAAMNATKTRILSDNQIIFLKYASLKDTSKISYTERLQRPFNILRTMEATRIIWSVTNASYKTQFIIPVGSVTSTRGRQKLTEACSNYRQLVNFNWDNGEIKTNGEPMMPFYKEYWLPSENGESPQIQTLGNDGPDLSDTNALSYFRNKFKQASKIPMSRFDMDGTGAPGMFSTTADGQASYEELKYVRFINRLRSIFQQIIIKPLYIQICLKYPKLAEDERFSTYLNLDYNDNSSIDELREIELLQKRAESLSAISQAVVYTDKDGNQTPYFDTDFLCQKVLGLSEDDIKLNQKYKTDKIERVKLEKEGYKDSDIDRILAGEDKSNFKIDKAIKKQKDKEAKEDKENSESGGFGNL